MAVSASTQRIEYGNLKIANSRQYMLGLERVMEHIAQISWNTCCISAAHRFIDHRPCCDADIGSTTEFYSPIFPVPGFRWAREEQSSDR